MTIRIVFLTGMMLVGLMASTYAEDSTVQQQLQGFNLNGYNNTGQKTWEVNGDKADISEDKIKVTNVDANFFGKEKANLTSKKGTIDKVSGQVHLQDDVVITSERGTKMTTDSLDWNRNQNLITTKDSVQITDKQGVVTGEGMTARSDLKQASINKDVKAIINTNGKTNKLGDNNSQKVTITCDGPMKMDQLHFHASFSDNVVALEESTGRELYADKMDVWFDDKSKKIKKVICKGHVKSVQGGNATYSQEMIYTGEDEQLVMTGRPKIVFDTGSSKGDGMFKGLGNK
jgi:LPS export ABC transporter protein LptC